MLFLIFLVLLIGLTVVTFATAMELGIFPLGFVLVLCVLWMGEYTSYVSNIAIIKEQYRAINVQKERLSSLNKNLLVLSTSEIKTALLNGDTPVASLVASISDAEKQLAYEKTVLASAYKNNEATKLGLLNSVTWFFDESLIKAPQSQ